MSNPDNATSDFLQLIHHELQDPLQKIYGMRQLLKTSHTPESYLSNMTILDQNLDRLGASISKLLRSAQGVSREISTELTPFFPSEFKEKMAQNAKQLLKNRASLRIQLLLPNPFPDSMLTHTHILEVVLQNLLENAVTHTHSGTITVRLSLTATHLRVSVEDTGNGMESQKLGQFHQGSTYLTRKEQGLGLGLSICSQHLALVGSALTIHSQPGAGTTIFFDLPYSIHINQIRFPLNNKNTSATRVLLVDDDPFNCLVLESMIKKAGYSCTVANSAKAAIQLCTHSPFDLVLMDIQMPEMDGIQAMKRIVTSSAHTPKITAITAHGSESDETYYRSMGFDGYLPKPIKEERLLQHLTSWAMS